MSEILENQSLNPDTQNQAVSTSTVNVNTADNISAQNVSDETSNDAVQSDPAKDNKGDSSENDYDSLLQVIQKISDAKDKLNKEMDSKKQYLNKNLSKYDSENYFQNDSFKNLYSEAFSALGTNLDTDKFINLLDKYVESRINLHSKNLAAQKENNSATDSMNFDSGISKKTDKVPRMQDIPDNELEKYIAKYV